MSETIPDELKTRDRDRWLACLYAPDRAQPGLMTLFALDLELGQVVATTTEPMIGQIRLAWWREALEGLDVGRVPAQPLLAAVAETLVPHDVTGAELAGLEDRWVELIGSEAVPDSHVAGGGLLFALAARLLGGEEALGRRLGEAWVLADGAGLPPVSKALRPLLGLVRLAERDAARARAGEPREVRGSLPRQWRLLRAVLTGR